MVKLTLFLSVVIFFYLVVTIKMSKYYVFEH